MKLSTKSASEEFIQDRPNLSNRMHTQQEIESALTYWMNNFKQGSGSESLEGMTLEAKYYLKKIEDIVRKKQQEVKKKCEDHGKPNPQSQVNKGAKESA